MLKSLRGVISRAYREHRYLVLKTDFLYADERHKFDMILNEDPSADYKRALATLTELLHRYHKKRVIVLIDEYDIPVNEAFLHKYYKTALAFLTSAFTGSLKDNPCVTDIISAFLSSLVFLKKGS